jgi:starch synthase
VSHVPASADGPLKIGYMWTGRMPSKETHSQQVVSTIDALAQGGADVELVLPGRWSALFRGGAKKMEQAIRDFYDVHAPFRVKPLYLVPPSKIEVERPFHGVFATLFKTRRYDVVHTRSRATMALGAAMGRPIVLETYRRLGEDAPKFARTLAWASHKRGFLGVICHSQQSADSLIGAGVREDRVRVLHNGWDPRKLEPRMSKTEAREALGLPLDKQIVVYTGNVQRSKGLDTVLDMAERTPTIDYIIVGGDAGHLKALQANIAARGLTNVKTPGWFPAAQLPAWMYASDVLIIPPTAGALNSGRTVLPMKVFAYVAAGRPILAADLPDVGEVLTDGVNARLVPPDDTDAAVEALEGLLASKELAEALSAGALSSASGLSWPERGRKLLAQYRAWIAANAAERGE